MRIENIKRAAVLRDQMAASADIHDRLASDSLTLMLGEGGTQVKIELTQSFAGKLRQALRVSFAGDVERCRDELRQLGIAFDDDPPRDAPGTVPASEEQS